MVGIDIKKHQEKGRSLSINESLLRQKVGGMAGMTSGEKLIGYFILDARNGCDYIGVQRQFPTISCPKQKGDNTISDDLPPPAQMQVFGTFSHFDMARRFQTIF